jgi:hypothetical protein
VSRGCYGRGIAIGADRPDSYREPRWLPLAAIGAMFGIAYATTTRASSKIRQGRGRK